MTPTPIYGPLHDVIVLIFIILCCGIYLAPSLIARNRYHPKTGQILILNTVLGVTVIGWVIALFWAFKSKKV